MKAIRWMIYKEFKQVRRDRRLLAILIVAPVVQLLLLGMAATTDVREVIIGVRDYDHSYHSREFVRSLGASGYLKMVTLRDAEEEDAIVLRSGRAGLVLIIPDDFSRTLLANQPADIQVLVDGSDSNFAVQGLNYLQKATRLYSANLALVTAERAGSNRSLRPGSRIIPETRIWYNPDLRSKNFMIPAIMGILLLIITMLVTSMALVKEREEGTMEQLIITPLRPFDIMLGKLLPFAIIGFIEITLALPVIIFVFGIHPQGSILLLYFLTALFLLTTLGLGLLISTLVKTQQQAMLLAAFGVMMPFALLSGFIFPIENMPSLLQPITYLIPLRYYLEIVRGIFLKGSGLAELWPQALALCILGVAILATATSKFHKRLD